MFKVAPLAGKPGNTWIFCCTGKSTWPGEFNFGLNTPGKIFSVEKKIIYSQNRFLFEKKLFEVSGSQNLPLKFKSLKKLALRWVADSLNVSLPKCEHQSHSVLLVIKLNRDIW